MNYLDTVHKRKSAAITAIIILLLLFIIFVFGLKYIDPPMESGIAVNFGTSNVGSGPIQPLAPIKTIVLPQEPEEQIDVSEPEKASPEEDAPSEELLTQDSEASIKIKEQEDAAKVLRDTEIAAEKSKIKAEAKAKAAAEKIQKEQDEKKKKLDAIFGGLENNDGAKEGGEGGDKIGGDKGKDTGDLTSKGYLSNGGSGGTGDNQLGNRKKLVNPSPKYKECNSKSNQNKSGIVIVKIEVDRSGKVIRATAGHKGSTITDECLLLKAKEAALNIKYIEDPTGAVRQVGSLTYVYGITE
jgi:colicin import membrane protein